MQGMRNDYKNFLAYKIKRMEAAIEFEPSPNKLHRKIGFDDWMKHRPEVPDYIPKEQVALYIFKLVKKERKGMLLSFLKGIKQAMKIVSILLLVCIFTLCGCGKESFTLKREAEILTTDKFGTVLCVKFGIGEHVFFEDLKLSNSLSAYYSESKTIPLSIKVTKSCLGDCYSMRIGVQGYHIKQRSISREVFGNIKDTVLHPGF